MSWAGIVAFRLVSADPERLVRFYVALGFAGGLAVPIAAVDMARLRLTGGAVRRTLRLGPSTLEIDAYEDGGRPYPEDADAASLCFQHLALVTNDVGAAWERARGAGAAAISRDGPVKLPESSGGVTAIKFRDPDGHPLELLQFPDGAAHGWPGAGMLGIDHSAISVADPGASAIFYRERGLSRGDATLNRGPTQVALDGLDDVEVDVVPLEPSRTPPHVELLGYRTPVASPCPSWQPNDIVATRIVWAAGEDALVRDPDGHLHELIERAC